MYTLTKTFRFEASHQLHHHDGKCRRLHGHSWRMTVEVARAELDTEGPKRNMAIDFTDISRAVQPMVEEYLDHYHLNDTLDTDSPTSEYIARWAYQQLAPHLPGLVAVTIHETCTCACRYQPRP